MQQSGLGLVSVQRRFAESQKNGFSRGDTARQRQELVSEVQEYFFIGEVRPEKKGPKALLFMNRTD